MKVLSIRQPWASIIINGYKNYEFRSWKTNFRGRVLIHASKGIETEYLDRFESLGLDYPTSAILGSVEITDCVKVTKDFEDELIKENELVYGATKGRAGYGFLMENVVKFDEVIPANGELGFWEYLEPEEVLDIMDLIDYGWIDKDNIFYFYVNSNNYERYYLSSPKETIKKKCGLCIDQVELERYYLRWMGNRLKTYFIVYYDKDNNNPAHTFLTYESKGKYYWFEHSWEKYKGIYEYDSIDDLIFDVKNKFILDEEVEDLEGLKCYMYKKPKFNMSMQEFYEHCESGVEIKL